MHPALKVSLEPLAKEVKPLSLEEAQVSSAPGQERWSAQQILEHLILSYRLTTHAVNRQIKSGLAAPRRRNMLRFILRIQTLALGHMPHGVPSIHALRPGEIIPMAGTELAARFLQAAETMDLSLVAARKKFGIQACGEHPVYGALRVDEWRRYHSVHARHHARQLAYAIRYAKGL